MRQSITQFARQTKQLSTLISHIVDETNNGRLEISVGMRAYRICYSPLSSVAQRLYDCVAISAIGEWYVCLDRENVSFGL